MQWLHNFIESVFIALLFLAVMITVAFGGSIFLKNEHKASVPDALDDLQGTSEAESGTINFPFARVIKVTDGDTITVSTVLTSTSASSSDASSSEDFPVKVLVPTEYKVRMIGINTPETVDPRKEVECFGKEASAKAKEVLANKIVRLDLDPTQQKFDKYNRLLAYVYVIESPREIGSTLVTDAQYLFFNKYMIENGFAYEYTYGMPYVFQKEFKAAEQAARDARRGLWGNRLTSGAGCN